MASKPQTRNARAVKRTNGKLSKLSAEREEFAQEVKRLRKEKSELVRSLGALLCGPVAVNKRAMLAEAATQPTLDELIAEIENSEA
ncbi:MAG: hypothetical protein HY289_02840 [Planctomycetes bacterium]|nr:hypothetical protein [Planctomycetota bacterium]